jgi:hypothetical protein
MVLIIAGYECTAMTQNFESRFGIYAKENLIFKKTIKLRYGLKQNLVLCLAHARKFQTLLWRISTT